MGVLGRFKADQSGATAMLFGLSLLPVMGLVGGAVDYSRAAGAHTDMQRALDATALALVKEPLGASQATLDQKAAKVFADTFRHEHITALGPVVVSRDGRKVTVSGSGTLDNAIMKVVGLRTSPISATSSAVWGKQKIELALVLDNTGSMNDMIGGERKIDALQKQVLDSLKKLRDIAAEPDSIKVSIVPFDTEVRLDAGKFRDKTWFRWMDAGMRPADWSGYVYDRFGTYARSDDAPGPSQDSLFPAARDSEYRRGHRMGDISRIDLPAVRPLTSLYDNNDYETLRGIVKSMKPRGFTNVALGAVWGNATLSRSEPFTEGAAAGDEGVMKYMVLLTDGLNTAHHVNGVIENAEWLKGEGRRTEAASVVARIDDNTKGACQAVKAAKIELFTIRLLDGDEALLRDCASAPASAHYFNVQNPNDLSGAFKAILDRITVTRLTN